MSLFYLNEHTSCYNYSNFIEEGFRYYKFDKGINYEERLIKDCILFVLKGNLQFLYNEFEFTVSEGNMFFWSRDSLFNMYSSEESEVVVALFEGGISPCQKASFADLFHLKKIIKYHMESLVIRDELRKFLELLVCYLEQTVYTFMRLSSKNCFGTFVFIILGRNRQTSSTQLSVDPRI